MIVDVGTPDGLIELPELVSEDRLDALRPLWLWQLRQIQARGHCGRAHLFGGATWRPWVYGRPWRGTD